MWQTKVFKTRAAMYAWLTEYGHRMQWREIFVNNAFGIEYKPLRFIWL